MKCFGLWGWSDLAKDTRCLRADCEYQELCFATKRWLVRGYVVILEERDGPVRFRKADPPHTVVKEEVNGL